MGAETDHGGLAGLGQTAPHLHLRPVGFVVVDDVVFIVGFVVVDVFVVVDDVVVVGFVVVDDVVVDDVVVVSFVVDFAAVVVDDAVVRVENWPSHNMHYDYFFLL